jgi:hypothetical protein
MRATEGRMGTDRHGIPPDNVEFGDPVGAPSPRPGGPGRPRGCNLLRLGRRCSPWR